MWTPANYRHPLQTTLYSRNTRTTNAIVSCLLNSNNTKPSPSVSRFLVVSAFLNTGKCKNIRTSNNTSLLYRSVNNIFSTILLLGGLIAQLSTNVHLRKHKRRLSTCSLRVIFDIQYGGLRSISKRIKLVIYAFTNIKFMLQFVALINWMEISHMLYSTKRLLSLWISFDGRTSFTAGVKRLNDTWGIYIFSFSRMNCGDEMIYYVFRK